MSTRGRYTVRFERGGQTYETTCVTIEGYSTEADIPKMIAIKYGEDAVITETIPLGGDPS